MGQEELYIATYSRFGPWVIGVTFGYIIYEAKQKELKLSSVTSQFYFLVLVISKAVWKLYVLLAVAQLVEALRYMSEGCGFDSRCCH
jgi:hypothetical protein